MAVDYKERARQRAKERSSGFWFKLTVGENTFRILPTPESETTPGVFMEYGVHRDVGPKKMTVRCGKDPVTNKGRCWLCDKKIPALREGGKEARASALESESVTILQVAVMNAEGILEGPRGYNPSKKVGDSIIGSVLGSKRRDYVDPKKGYNISITRHGTGKNDTRYDPIEPDEEPSSVPSEIIKKLKPFSELKELPVYDEAKQKAAYEGRDLEESAAEEEEEPPVKKKPSKRPVEDEEEEEPEEEAEEEEPEEEAEEEEVEEEEEPVKKKKKPAVEDEEEELPKPKKKKPPVEEDEEEEEPKPKKKKPLVEDDEEEDLEAEDAEEEPEEDAEEEEEEEAPPPKRKVPLPPPKKKK